MLELLIIGVGVGAATGIVSAIREHGATRRESSPEWQIQAAHLRVDDALVRARVAMEEAAGVREPGESRLSDSFGNWQGWL